MQSSGCASPSESHLRTKASRAGADVGRCAYRLVTIYDEKITMVWKGESSCYSLRNDCSADATGHGSYGLCWGARVGEPGRMYVSCPCSPEKRQLNSRAPPQ
jgi:hypothetical protein